METNLVHGEGDLEGEPFQLAPHLEGFLYRWFEYDVDDDGAFANYCYRKGLLGYPKGHSKTEFEAALGLEHLCGPAATRGTPVVTVAAVDGDQADELVRVASQLVADTPLAEQLKIDNGRISQRFGEGRMLATSAAIGKNDGKKTSLLLNDEIHEWDTVSDAGRKRHRVLERNTNKRGRGRSLNVTTAGWSLESLAGAMYTYGQAVANGDLVDPSFLMEWWEASEGWDLSDPAQLEAAIREANPAIATYLPLDNLLRSYHEHDILGETDEWVRYHLNRWVGSLDDVWMDMAAWAARTVDRPAPAAGTRVVLGFDGSESTDATALVGCTVEARPHVFLVGLWESAARKGSWRVPHLEVEQAITDACARWDVAEVACDEAHWAKSLKKLADAGLPIVKIPQSPKRMAAASQLFIEATDRDYLTHDGDKRLTAHIGNCRRKETEFDGARIAKEHLHSKRHIDAAVAAVMAHERAVFHAGEATQRPVTATAPTGAGMHRYGGRLASRHQGQLTGRLGPRS